MMSVVLVLLSISWWLFRRGLFDEAIIKGPLMGFQLSRILASTSHGPSYLEIQPFVLRNGKSVVDSEERLPSTSRTLHCMEGHFEQALAPRRS